MTDGSVEIGKAKRMAIDRPIEPRDGRATRPRNEPQAERRASRFTDRVARTWVNTNGSVMADARTYLALINAPEPLAGRHRSAR